MGLTNFTPSNPGAGNVPAFPVAQANDGIDQYLVNLNEKHKNSQPILYREAVIEQTMGILITAKKPNVILIGAAGVGKTAIAEDIARRIANNDPSVPDALKDHTLYELPLANLVAGAMYQGMVEENIKTVIEFLEKSKAIVFIDEIHMLLSGDNSYQKVAQILKPALARGTIKVVGATTSQEYKNLQTDPAFNRRFSRVLVDEFTQDQTKDILTTMIPVFVKHYGPLIQLGPDIIQTATIIADQYHAPGNHRPDTAITLLDRSIATAIMARKKQEQAAANDPNLLAAINAVPFIPVTESIIKKTARRIMMGVAKSNDFDVDELKQSMTVIKGQDDVVDHVLDKLYRRSLGLRTPKQPLSFLFAGPSGVGKTEITRIVARELTQCDPIILNMTEYNSSADITRIIGAPPGYVGYSEHSELPFDILETNPYQIILLDEFEKSHPSIQALFMSVLDDGVLTMAKGNTIDFSNSIIIATTNAGHTANAKTLGFTQSKAVKSHQNDVSMLSKYFRPEILNRFSAIYTFNPISKDTYREILQDKFLREKARLMKERPGTTLPDVIPDDVLDDMVDKTYAEEFGARPAAKAVNEFIEDCVMATI